MTERRSRLHAVLRLARHREGNAKARHHEQLQRIDTAREQFIDAQHRASTDAVDAGSADELRRRRAQKQAAARAALAHEAHLHSQVEEAVITQNELHAAMRYKRTVERIDDRHRKAWAVLASHAAERMIDDIATSGWQRRQER